MKNDLLTRLDQTVDAFSDVDGSEFAVVATQTITADGKNTTAELTYDDLRDLLHAQTEMIDTLKWYADPGQNVDADGGARASVTLEKVLGRAS